MLLTIAEFRERVGMDMPGLVRALQEQTGRSSNEEAEAWSASLPALCSAFQDPMFQPLHLYFGDRGYLSLEYRVPSASSWCDVVLLGAHTGRPSAVILELKDWQTRSDKPGHVEGVIQRHGVSVLHPSEQVRGYVEYCRRFHSTVLEQLASVEGCVLFTRDRYLDVFRRPPNSALANDFPCFAVTQRAVDPGLVEFFRERLTEPDEVFAVSVVRLRTERCWPAT